MHENNVIENFGWYGDFWYRIDSVFGIYWLKVCLLGWERMVDRVPCLIWINE